MKIQRIHVTPTDAAQIPAFFDKAGIDFTTVGIANWKEFPYCPTAQVRMALTDDTLLIHYHAEEEAVLARYDRDNDPVWTDSCMECFLLGHDGRTYYNIECNCIGTLLVGRGDKRTDRIRLPQEQLATVARWSTLGRQPFGLRNEPTTWDLTLAIPFAMFGADSVIFTRQTLKGNVYKCGDDLPTPHFVSLFPIPIEEPDFHRPDHFGVFEVQ